MEAALRGVIAYNSDAGSHRPLYEDKIANKLCYVGYTTFSVLNVTNVVNRMKLGKCPGPTVCTWKHFLVMGGASVYTFVSLI